jgi:hypothetical protein
MSYPNTHPRFDTFWENRIVASAWKKWKQLQQFFVSLFIPFLILIFFVLFFFSQSLITDLRLYVGLHWEEK